MVIIRWIELLRTLVTVENGIDLIDREAKMGLSLMKKLVSNY
jgi:hypothetical protein